MLDEFTRLNVGFVSVRDPGLDSTSAQGRLPEPGARSGPARRLEHRPSCLERCGAAAGLRRAASALPVRPEGPGDGPSRLLTGTSSPLRDLPGRAPF
jgi:hypothetical protein